MMNIHDLKPDMRKVNVTGVIASVGETRTVNMKDGSTAEVRDVVLTDPTGEVRVSLWGDRANEFKEGDRVEVNNGYTTSFKGNVQLSVGMFGSIKKLVVAP